MPKKIPFSYSSKTRVFLPKKTDFFLPSRSHFGIFKLINMIWDQPFFSKCHAHESCWTTNVQKTASTTFIPFEIPNETSLKLPVGVFFCVYQIVRFSPRSLTQRIQQNLLFLMRPIGFQTHFSSKLPADCLPSLNVLIIVHYVWTLCASVYEKNCVLFQIGDFMGRFDRTWINFDSSRTFFSSEPFLLKSEACNISIWVLIDKWLLLRHVSTRNFRVASCYRKIDGPHVRGCFSMNYKHKTLLKNNLYFLQLRLNRTMSTGKVVFFILGPFCGSVIDPVRPKNSFILFFKVDFDQNYIFVPGFAWNPKESLFHYPILV